LGPGRRGLRGGRSLQRRVSSLREQKKEAVPSHSERIRRHYPPGWWQQLQDQRKGSATCTGKCDSIATGYIRRDAGEMTAAQ